MMNAAFAALGLDAVYGTSSVGPAELPSAMAKARGEGARGLNVTMPHKTAVARLLDSLDVVPSKIGAVNTVSREGLSYRGYNTDVDGILQPLRSRGLRPRRALVIGTGGASRAFCAAMHGLGCEELTALSRDPPRAEGFLSQMRAAFPEMRLAVAPVGSPPPGRPDLLFNASPAGPGAPLPARAAQLLDARPTVFDAVYYPVETGLIRLAEKMKCPTICGHEMLLHQGLKSVQLWTGRSPPLDAMRSALLGSLGVAA